MNMTKNDFKILSVLFKDKCTNEMKSYTIIKLSQVSEFSITKIRACIKTFLEEGDIAEGYKSGSAKSYYITQKGIEKVMKFIQ